MMWNMISFLSDYPEGILMHQSLQFGSPSPCMALWTVLCVGEWQNMASSRGEKISTILFASKTRTTGCTWPLVRMMAVPLDELYMDWSYLPFLACGNCPEGHFYRIGNALFFHIIMYCIVIEFFIWKIIINTIVVKSFSQSTLLITKLRWVLNSVQCCKR